jgi:ABC exporter DevB family membrane fusion protein
MKQSNSLQPLQESFKQPPLSESLNNSSESWENTSHLETSIEAESLANLSLEELQAEVEHLQQHWQHSLGFVKEQEEELKELCQTITELKKRLRGTTGRERLSLSIALANERERQQLLAATLLGQHHNLQEQQIYLKQYQQALQQRQNSLNPSQEQVREQVAQPISLSSEENLTTPEEENAQRYWWRWWVIPLSVTALLVLGATAFYTLQMSRSQPPAPPTPASQSPTAKTVAALGYLEPQGEIIKLSAPAFLEGARVEQLLVKQGNFVRAGQVVAILDNRDSRQAALQQAQTQVKIAQARLQQVKAGAKVGDIQAQDAKFQRSQAELQGQITSQQATIATLEAELDGEQNAQQAGIERIAAELTHAQNDCRRYQILYQDGGVSIQELDRVCLQAKTSQERLLEAKANLRRTVDTLQDRISEAKANLQRTTTTLQKQIEEERATLKAVAEVRPVDVQVARAELQAARAAVQKAEADLKLAYIRAPRAGQILKIHTWPGEIVSKEGIVDLGQTEQMYVTAQVYETDISRIRIGQPAIIKSDGIVADLQGTVDEVGLQIGRKDVLGTDPVADADARVVEVKIRLTPESSQKVAGLTNLQVNVIINTSGR